MASRLALCRRPCLATSFPDPPLLARCLWDNQMGGAALVEALRSNLTRTSLKDVAPVITARTHANGWHVDCPSSARVAQQYGRHHPTSVADEARKARRTLGTPTPCRCEAARASFKRANVSASSSQPPTCRDTWCKAQVEREQAALDATRRTTRTSCSALLDVNARFTCHELLRLARAATALFVC